MESKVEDYCTQTHVIVRTIQWLQAVRVWSFVLRRFFPGPLGPGLVGKAFLGRRMQQNKFPLVCLRPFIHPSSFLTRTLRSCHECSHMTLHFRNTFHLKDNIQLDLRSRAEFACDLVSASRILRRNSQYTIADWQFSSNIVYRNEYTPRSNQVSWGTCGNLPR